MSRKIAIVKCGSSLPQVIRVCGDFEDMISRKLELPPEAIKVISPVQGGSWPDLHSLYGIEEELVQHGRDGEAILREVRNSDAESRLLAQFARLAKKHADPLSSKPIPCHR